MTFLRYEGQMLDGQPHGNGSIVYMANDKFGRANYTGFQPLGPVLALLVLPPYLILIVYFRGVAVWDNHWRGYYALEKRGKVIAQPSQETESIFEISIFLHVTFYDNTECPKIK